MTADETVAPSRKATGFRTSTNLDANPGLKAVGAVSLGTPVSTKHTGFTNAEESA